MPRSTDSDDGLRIGELAELAGTTTRAIRHYHAEGLLAEPPRDRSGYRRYGSEQLVRLVRIRRLRSLGMPLDQIGAIVASGPGGEGVLPEQLAALADDIGREIAELRDLQRRVVELAKQGTLRRPVEAWSAALRRQGLLGEGAELPQDEHRAVDLLDALHPEGIAGVIEQTSELIADPALVERLGGLLERFRALPDDASDDAVEALAADYADALPRPQSRPPAIAVEAMDRLIGAGLSPARRRVVQRVRQLLEARDA